MKAEAAASPLSFASGIIIFIFLFMFLMWFLAKKSMK
jgi:hypothetical protein